MLMSLEANKEPFGTINPKNVIVCQGLICKITGIPLYLRQYGLSHVGIREDAYEKLYLPPDSQLSFNCDTFGIAAVSYEMITHKSRDPGVNLLSNINFLPCSDGLKNILKSLINYNSKNFSYSEIIDESEILKSLIII